MLNGHLNIEDCAAYIKCKSIQYISWDTDISTLKCNKVFVEYLESFPIPIYFRHTPVSTRYMLSLCSVCEKIVFRGYICKNYNKKYHVRCILYCEHVKNIIK